MLTLAVSMNNCHYSHLGPCSNYFIKPSTSLQYIASCALLMVTNKTKSIFLSMKHMNTYVKKHKLENWAFLKHYG
jgi:pyrimidine deaminase RibD-like protein